MQNEEEVSELRREININQDEMLRLRKEKEEAERDLQILLEENSELKSEVMFS